MLPIQRSVLPRRILDGLLLTLLVAVEVAWLGAIAVAVWLAAGG
jgi:hypothetical protein